MENYLKISPPYIKEQLSSALSSDSHQAPLLLQHSEQTDLQMLVCDLLTSSSAAGCVSRAQALLLLPLPLLLSLPAGRELTWQGLYRCSCRDLNLSCASQHPQWALGCDGNGAFSSWGAQPALPGPCAAPQAHTGPSHPDRPFLLPPSLMCKGRV